MTREVVQKIENGDALTDMELLDAHYFYSDLAEKLSILGPHFHHAWKDCYFRAKELEGYINERAKR